MAPLTKAEGRLYEQADEFARALAAQEAAQSTQMLAAWSDSYWGVRQEIDALMDKVAAARAAGVTPSPAWAVQQQRLKNVLNETKAQMARYADTAAQVTTRAQRAAVAAGVKHAERLAATAVAEQLGPGATLARINPAVLEAGVGFLADGSVLSQHLAATLPGPAAERVRGALIHGLATGKGQDWMVARATEALGITHTRAVTILRTESLRAYRHASRATYLANQAALGSWTWHAALDARCCIACVLMDGTEHPLDATLDGHPRCRCAMVPRTKTWDDILGKPTGLPDTRPPVRSGRDWLLAQPADVQRSLMGGAKYEAWQGGAIHLDDMVGRTYSPQWGTMRAERSLKAIQEGRNPNPPTTAPTTDPPAVRPSVDTPTIREAREVAQRGPADTGGWSPGKWESVDPEVAFPPAAPEHLTEIAARQKAIQELLARGPRNSRKPPKPIANVFQNGNKRVVVHPKLTRKQLEGLLDDFDAVLAKVPEDVQKEALEVLVPDGDKHFKGPRAAGGYVFMGEKRIQLSPSAARGGWSKDQRPGWASPAWDGAESRRYVLTHEMGHVVDGLRQDTVALKEGDFRRGMVKVDKGTNEGGFWRETYGLPESVRVHPKDRPTPVEGWTYAKSNAQEGYAEAFAQYQLGGPGSSPVSDAYARRYGW